MTKTIKDLSGLLTERKKTVIVKTLNKVANAIEKSLESTNGTEVPFSRLALSYTHTTLCGVLFGISNDLLHIVEVQLHISKCLEKLNQQFKS